jgi:7-cyano-7-deazaguanine synthase
MEATVNQAMGDDVRIETPYAELSKIDVIHLGRGLPLNHTFSCIAPLDGRHCGRCNKCAERRRAFAAAGVEDPSEYANPSPPVATGGL